MIPYFDSSEFLGVTGEMLAAYDRDGVLVLEDLIPAAECQRLLELMDQLVRAADPSQISSVFSSTDADKMSDDYLRRSADRISFFLESDALDAAGRLKYPLHRAINKAGHALHDRDPIFNAFSRRPEFHRLCLDLGMVDPRLMQSMYIFKHAGIGGEVDCHQDAPFLWTTPQSVMGIWVALEDATLENGCLWGVSGAHKEVSPRKRFTGVGNGATMTVLDERSFDESARQPLPVKAGTVIVLHGQFPHLSAANRSEKSRQAYALHVVDGRAEYSTENWLQRSKNDPATGFNRL